MNTMLGIITNRITSITNVHLVICIVFLAGDLAANTALLQAYYMLAGCVASGIIQAARGFKKVPTDALIFVWSAGAGGCAAAATMGWEIGKWSCENLDRVAFLSTLH
jgi:hypothetical protein